MVFVYKTINKRLFMHTTASDVLPQSNLFPLTQTDTIELPSFLEQFRQNGTAELCDTVRDGITRQVVVVSGDNLTGSEEQICPKCGCVMHSNGHTRVNLIHLPLGGAYTVVRINNTRVRCSSPYCECSKTVPIACQDDGGHRITKAARKYVEDLLVRGFTLKDTAEMSGIGKNAVKEIDKHRLQQLYTVEGKGEKFIKPERQATYLGIDEFKLHHGHKYATVILDLESGHILWLAYGKGKDTVYKFIEHVGTDWMSRVKAVASDMNADYAKAFKERCPHLSIVYDHFHLVKNFNDKVLAPVRKDEQARLTKAGDKEAATALKRSKYILYSSRQTLQKKDEAAKNFTLESQQQKLCERPDFTPKANYLERYERLLMENKLLFTADLVKEQMNLAYSSNCQTAMAGHIDKIIELCEATKNEHFKGFARLLRGHYEGIVSFADHHISTGKVEGTNQAIKTLRRKSYGYNDDDYFFLKLFDYTRRPKKGSEL